MPSNLPSESALDKAVDSFGLGTYDFPLSGLSHGEDSNTKKKEVSLPDDGGPLDPFGPDRLLSYPSNMASSSVPGDYDRPARQKTPPPSHLDSVVHSVSQSRLPSGGPVTRTDYYDKMTVGQSVDNMFAHEDAGVYASESEDLEAQASESEDESVPGPVDNYSKFNNSLNSLGNYWSGYVMEDQSVPAGFPSTEFEDQFRWQKTNASSKNMNRLATNIKEVRSLTSSLIKDIGKKNISRRHIMAYLQKKNSYQFLASDIIRCLREDHDIYVRDALDHFPTVKTAGGKSLGRVRDTLIELETLNIRDPHAAELLRLSSADITNVIALLEKYGVDNV